ncbi:hypothetical protein ACE939_03085 [Aquimarina sp. W85]|uniref:hypothetical protein n=1 Tax=Aquimarina rhodophyticola TaxID=3342246 RepID=UPI00367178F3
MKNIYFKSFIYLLLLVCGTNLSAQTQQGVKDSVLIDIPNIGSLGGAHLLNWALDTDDNSIYFYAYSHVKGSQIVSSTEELEAAKQEHDDKSFFGKMISNVATENTYQDTTIPVVLEGKIQSDDMSMLDTKRFLFHKVEALPNGKNVFFKPEDNVMTITGFEPGTMLDYHYSDLDKAFKYAPLLDKELLSLTELKVKGEGLLGLKNIKPWITNKKAFFRYVPFKGYMSDTEEKDLINLKENPELEGYEFLRESDNSSGSNHIVWFAKTKDATDYKMVCYNEKSQKTTIQSFTFDTPRKPKVINKIVFDTELTPVGFVTIFGYHRKGKKSETYLKTDFDAIYTDLEGTIKFQTKFSHGTEKKYKNVVSPLIIIDNGDGVLRFINNHQLSLAKSDFEVFTLNQAGEAVIERTEPFSTMQGESTINYYKYLVGFDAIYMMGDHYVVRKNTTESKSVAVPNSSIPKTTILNTGFKYTVLDKDFTPVRFGSVYSGQDQKSSFRHQVIEMTDDKMIVLSTRGGKYDLTTITAEAIETIGLDTEYSDKASNTLYFGSYLKNFALVNEKNRELFILHQFYNTSQTNGKILDKVAIVKVGY